MQKFAKTLLSLGVALCVPALLSAQTMTSGRDTLRLSLDEAIQIALNDNHSILIADQEIVRVDYLKKETWYNLLPDLSASSQYTNNILKPVFFTDFAPGGKMTVGSTHAYNVGGQLTVPLFAMGIYKSIEISAIDMRLALEGARDTKINLIAQVKNAFYGILLAQESVEVLKQSQTNVSEMAANISHMYQEGLASEYDKIRTDVAARNILPMLTSAENACELAKLQLKVLLSIDLETPIKINGGFMAYENEIANYRPDGEYSLENNSQIKQLDITRERLERTVELIRTQRLPTVGGFASYSLQMQNNDFNFREPWANSLSMGLSISIPIFNKFSNKMKERQTMVGIRQLDLQRDMAGNNLRLAAQNSINEMLRAQLQITSNKEAVSQASKGYDIAKVRYQAEMGTVLELNDSEMALTQAQLNLKQSIYDYLRARNEYEKVLGTQAENIENTK